MKKSKKLIKGFSEGFPLKYKGRKDVKQNSPNLELHVGNKLELWNKVMKEVGEKRYAGPFKEIPYDNYIQSPIGLVPKDQGRKTQLIFHLSYPRNPKQSSISSVNAAIPKDECSVKYADFDEAVKLCLREGKGCHVGKSDMSMAFRHIPLKVKDFKYLILKSYHPITNQLWYFVEKCLPFGSSISCKHFQDFSDSVSHIVEFITKKRNVNYLDDFLFAHLMRMLCNSQVNTFLEVCRIIKFPVSVEKTFWGTTRLIFLGLLLDTINQVVCIPEEKIQKARRLLGEMLAKKKTTVQELQKLTGFLNFICKCVIPGRAFTSRMYSFIPSNMKPHYHINVNRELRMDLEVWKHFISQPDIYCRPFMDFQKLDADDIFMYSDASKSLTVGGFGALCDNDWMYSAWDYDFNRKFEPSIQYLELFALTAGVITWIRRFRNRRIYLFCDNNSVVFMINKSSSKCKHCMVLIRLITLEGLKHNVRIFAKHVETKKNNLVDALSRLRLDKFWEKAPSSMNKYMTPLPEEIWPMEKIWYQF